MLIPKRMGRLFAGKEASRGLSEAPTHTLYILFRISSSRPAPCSF